MQLDKRRQQIVHRYQPHIFAVALIAVEAEELWQERSGVLVKVHVVTRQKLLQEFAFFMLHCLDDELIVIGQIEDGSRGAGI